MSDDDPVTQRARASLEKWLRDPEFMADMRRSHEEAMRELPREQFAESAKR